TMNHWLRAAATAVLMLMLTACAVPQRDDCAAATHIAHFPAKLDEASGLAVSRRDPAVIWVHNDSEGLAMLYAIDRTGRLLAEIALPRAGAQFDWEDIAMGPCPAGDCLFIGDIGDNRHNRDDRAILRITEPRIADTHGIIIDRYPIRYPDGAEDAEAVFVMPDSSVYIVTKGRRHPVTLYRYPAPLRAGERVTLQRVQQLSDGIVQLPDLVTAADASADGRRIAIRTYSSLMLYRFDGDTLIATFTRAFDLTGLAEPQGEGVAFAGSDTLLLATEMGPFRAQPFLSRVRCPAR
ncbi:MAG: hypothetical protein ACRELT_14595, partial [Longimicrobiales bacterium]